MRLRTLACLSLVAGACAVAATGFPRRIGLTASQADVSLPGDLVLPGANVVVDRGIAIDAPASIVWDVLGHVFEPEDESTIIDIEDEDHILMRVAPPGAPEGAEASGTPRALRMRAETRSLCGSTARTTVAGMLATMSVKRMNGPAS